MSPCLSDRPSTGTSTSCAACVSPFSPNTGEVEPEKLPRSLTDETRSFLDRAQRSGSLHSWLAEDAGNCQGIVSVLLHDVPPLPEDSRTRQGLIINMYVLPEERQRGVGRALLEACLGSAPELGIRKFYLRATDDGRPMYLQTGFASDGNWMELKQPPVG